MVLERFEPFIQLAQLFFQVGGVHRVEPFEEGHDLLLHLVHVVHLDQEQAHRAHLVVQVVVDARFVRGDQVQDAGVALQIAC